MTTTIEKIFTVNLGVKKDEEVLVFTDIISQSGENIAEEERERRERLREIAQEVAHAGEGLAKIAYVEFPSLEGHGKEPPELLWEAAFGRVAVAELQKTGLLDKLLAKKTGPEELKRCESIVRNSGRSPAAVVALSNFSTSHTRFRDLLTRCMGTRYASMPLFDEPMLTGVMTADWAEVERITLNLIEKMKDAESVIITGPNGTSISFSIKGRTIEPDTGILTRKGLFGNLPAGEAFLAPVENTAVGTLVLEWGPTRKLRSPVTLNIKDGLVYNVEGDDEYAAELKAKLEENPLFGNIAELGIGTNSKATRPDNILETEKILGTIHIALGDNSSFGGKVSVPFHQDFIFFNPTMEVLKGAERVEILTDGTPQF
jgi:leucyl aminopeptidase (aminopeptidase T)